MLLYPYQLNQREGRRWSVADAYLRPALPRGNLTVKTGTLATKVLVEGTQATGVRYLHDGAEHVARSRGEVLLCGERSTAPKLAMASRIIRSACRSGTLLPPATSGRR